MNDKVLMLFLGILLTVAVAARDAIAKEATQASTPSTTASDRTQVGKKPAKTSRNSSKKPAKASKKSSKELTEDQAIDAVSKLPEVKKWSKLLSSTKGAGNPGYMADRDGAKWTVQVFESKADQNVTFGFYDVDAHTGAVKKEEF